MLVAELFVSLMETKLRLDRRGATVAPTVTPAGPSQPGARVPSPITP